MRSHSTRGPESHLWCCGGCYSCPEDLSPGTHSQSAIAGRHRGSQDCRFISADSTAVGGQAEDSLGELTSSGFLMALSPWATPSGQRDH